MGHLDFHLDEEVFAQLPLSLKGPPIMEDHHLPDVSGDFLKAFDHTGDIDNPTSSPSNSDADGSSARASEATPAPADTQQWTSVSSQSGSWHVAPQLLSVQADGAPVPAPVLYASSAQPGWGAHAQVWHSAFAASATQQQTSKGTL